MRCPYFKLKLSLQYFQGRSWQGFRKKGSSRYFQFKTFEDIGTFEELLYKVQQAMFFNWPSEQKQNYQIPRHRNIMSHRVLFFIGKRVRKVKHDKSSLLYFYFFVQSAIGQLVSWCSSTSVQLFDSFWAAVWQLFNSCLTAVELWKCSAFWSVGGKNGWGSCWYLMW